MHHTWVAVALALLLVPAGVAVGSGLEGKGKAVEQHTSYIQLIAQDAEDVPGFAAVAGLVSCHPTGPLQDAVLWFNDQLLLRTGRRAPDTSCIVDAEATHVWATEEGAPDPRGNPSLAPTGRVYEFQDPNGLDWKVTEYVYHEVYVLGRESAHVSALGRDIGVETEGEIRLLPHYTWVVKLGPSAIDPTIVEYYNFVTLVDFSRLSDPEGTAVHSGDRGQTRNGNSHNATEDASPTAPHAHDATTIHLWTGARPEAGPGTPYHNGMRVETRVLTPRDIV